MSSKGVFFRYLNIKNIIIKKYINIQNNYYKYNNLLPFILNLKYIKKRNRNKIIPYKRRCLFTGRGRGNYKVLLSRIMFRSFFHIGNLLGVKKASW